MRAQNAGGAFPLDVLQQVEELVDGVDMHDQPRAKMQKAIGAELVRACEALPDGSTDRTNVAARAIEHLRQAFALDPRIGVKTVIQRLEKSLPKLPTESLSVPAGVDGAEAHPAAPAVNADSVVATTAKDGNDATPPLEK